MADPLDSNHLAQEEQEWIEESKRQLGMQGPPSSKPAPFRPHSPLFSSNFEHIASFFD
jgi:hypothetical protein